MTTLIYLSVSPFLEVFDLSQKMIESLRAVTDEIKKMLTVKAAVGEPIEIEDKVLIPIFGIGVGVGGGGGFPGKEEESWGGGFGGGGGMSPIALIAVFKGVPGPEGVKIYSLKGPSTIAQIISQVVPSLLEKFMPSKGKPLPEEKREKLKEI